MRTWQFFEADQGTGSGGNAGEGSQETPQGETSGEKKPFLSFPDEASFASRLNREAKKLLAEQVKTLGFENVDAMNAALKAAKDHTDAQMTELQRAQQEAQTAKAERDQLATKHQQRLITAEAKLQAAALGIKPERVATALRLADLSGVSLGEDGEPDAAAIKTAIETVLTDLPELKGATASVGGGSNPAGATNTGKIDISSLSPKELADLQRRVMAGERITL